MGQRRQKTKQKQQRGAGRVAVVVPYYPIPSTTVMLCANIYSLNIAYKYTIWRVYVTYMVETQKIPTYHFANADQICIYSLIELMTMTIVMQRNSDGKCFFSPKIGLIDF